MLLKICCVIYIRFLLCIPVLQRRNFLFYSTIRDIVESTSIYNAYLEGRGYLESIKIQVKENKKKVFDKDSFDNIYNALYTMGSSKLCRKTHLDMLTKVQVNMYVSGHHKEGSSAVKHNSSLILKDRFIFMCAAYKQLNVIEK